jgi:hypothetical protein
MQSANIPVKVPAPWASAQGSPVTPTPLSSNTPGRASWLNGFGFLNLTPLNAGGVPPFGQDMNGVLQALSAWVQWQGAGGTVQWDSAFSTTIGGYPKGAMVSAVSGLGWYLSLIDNNPDNPDSGSVNWLFVPIDSAYGGNPNTHVAGMAAGNGSPPSLAWDSIDSVWWVCTVTGNAGSAVWIPLTVLISVVPGVTGNTQSYTAADVGQIKIRSNAGAAMSDQLPANMVGGWWIGFINNDALGAQLTITVPNGKHLNGKLNGTLPLVPGQNAILDVDVNGDYWIIVAPVPVVFSGQAIPIATTPTGPLAPGVYDVDTTNGPITLVLETGGSQGDNYEIRDVGGKFAQNNCTLDPGSRTIDSYVGTFALDVTYSRSHFKLNATPGDWVFALGL